MNKITLYGNLTDSPKTSVTQNGKTVAQFTIAVNHGWGQNKKCSFFRCAAFGQPADFLVQYAHKGSSVLAFGDIEQEEWTDKNGVKHRDFKTMIREIKLTSSKNATADNTNPFDELISASAFIDVDRQEEVAPF